MVVFRVCTFHFHIFGLAELLLAGFLLLLRLVVVVHVCDLTVAAVVVLVSLVRVGIRSERAPGSRRMQVRIGAARVGPGLR